MAIELKKGDIVRYKDFGDAGPPSYILGGRESKHAFTMGDEMKVTESSAPSFVSSGEEYVILSTGSSAWVKDLELVATLTSRGTFQYR